MLVRKSAIVLCKGAVYSVSKRAQIPSKKREIQQININNFFLYMEMENKMEMLKSNKGGLKIIHRGYMYTVHKRNYGRVRWRCSQRTLHCKGSITTGSGCEEGVPIINLPHNHLPDMHAAALARLRSFVINESEAATIAGLKSESTMDDSEFMDFEINNENDLLEGTQMLDPPQLKSILKPRNITAPKPPMPDKSLSSDSEMCLRWNSHHSNMQSSFPALMDQEQFVDVTLAVEGKLLRCHKLILSSCSAFFDEMLKHTSPHQETVIYLHGMEFWQVRALVDFMYKGEVNVDQTKLESLLKAAEELEVKGLAGKSQRSEPEEEEPDEEPAPPTPPPATIVKEAPEPLMKPESPIREDVQDEEYFPNPEFRRKYQGKKRKRKILVPPDPSYLKHVKLNLKGTKSRPNIKQPKFYSPDYPEYDPDRCISPPKMGSDPVFHIDNIKLEPIDIEQPHSPNLYQMNAQLDESESNMDLSNDELKTPIKVYKRFAKTDDIDNDSKDMEPSTSTKDSKISIESLLGKPMMIGNKKAIIVKCPNTKKIIEVAGQEESGFRVRALPTTETMLKKFATNQLTSILKKGDQSVCVKKTGNKPSILRQLPKLTMAPATITSTPIKTNQEKVLTTLKTTAESPDSEAGTSKSETEDIENTEMVTKKDTGKKDAGNVKFEDEDEDIIAD